MQHLENISRTVADKIIQRAMTINPFLVNISGCMGAGKSTYSDEIKRHLEELGRTVVLVSEDDFLQPRAFRSDLESIIYTDGEWKGKTKWEIHENWLRLDLMKQAVLNLKSSISIQYHPYQRETGTYSSDVKKVMSSEIVLVETSIFSELFDYVVLIEVKDDILLNRKIRRDADLRDQEKIIKYHNIAQWPYWLRHKPTKPNLVIDNNDMQNPILIEN